MASVDSERPWRTVRGANQNSLELVLIGRTYVLPWIQFLYAEGGEDEVRLVSLRTTSWFGERACMCCWPMLRRTDRSDSTSRSARSGSQRRPAYASGNWSSRRRKADVGRGS